MSKNIFSFALFQRRCREAAARRAASGYDERWDALAIESLLKVPEGEGCGVVEAASEGGGGDASQAEAERGGLSEVPVEGGASGGGGDGGVCELREHLRQISSGEVPYWFANESGETIDFWETTSSTRTSPPASFSTLESGGSTKLRLFGGRTDGRAREWHEDTEHAISIELPGCRPIHGIVVNSPGTCVVPLERADGQPPGMLQHRPLSLVCEVELHRSGTRLTVRSMLTVLNRSAHHLAVDLQIPGKPMLHAGILRPGASLAVPSPQLDAGLRLINVGSGTKQEVGAAFDAADLAAAMGREQPHLWLPALLLHEEARPSAADEGAWRALFERPPNELLLKALTCACANTDILAAERRAAETEAVLEARALGGLELVDRSRSGARRPPLSEQLAAAPRAADAAALKEGGASLGELWLGSHSLHFRCKEKVTYAELARKKLRSRKAAAKAAAAAADEENEATRRHVLSVEYADILSITKRSGTRHAAKGVVIEAEVPMPGGGVRSVLTTLTGFKEPNQARRLPPPTLPLTPHYPPPTLLPTPPYPPPNTRLPPP